MQLYSHACAVLFLTDSSSILTTPLSEESHPISPQYHLVIIVFHNNFDVVVTSETSSSQLLTHSSQQLNKVMVVSEAIAQVIYCYENGIKRHESDVSDARYASETENK